LPALTAVQHLPSGVEHTDNNCGRELPELLRHLAATSVHSLQQVSVRWIHCISFKDGSL